MLVHYNLPLLLLLASILSFVVAACAETVAIVLFLRNLLVWLILEVWFRCTSIVVHRNATVLADSLLLMHTIKERIIVSLLIES